MTQRAIVKDFYFPVLYSTLCASISLDWPVQPGFYN